MLGKFKGVSISFKGFQGYLKEVKKVCLGSFNGVKQTYKDVSRKF